jgi:hypothetical protein
VKVKRGAMEGWEVEVVEIDAAAGKAKFALQLLGACKAEIEIDGLEKL